MRLKRMLRMFLAVLAVWVVAVPEAHAYIDPGSGALLWQFVMAAVFGSLFFMRRAGTWAKIALRSLWAKVKGSRSA